ncbi:MAG TPA: ABC transporter permease subunit [Myxococcota bacterium]|jgi:ABC-type transport system involved in multi-copper enzyme maturation permease subunit|nr:ABC transporter permease subunit [Myxococcota bacterium]
MSRAELAAVARLDLGEVLRSRWLLLCLVLYALLGGVFVLVGLRESSVLGFTGVGRVLFSLCHALVLLLPLLALLATVQAVNRARDDGSLELFLSHPIGRAAFLTGVTGVRLAALTLPLALVMLALAGESVLVQGQAVPWGFFGRAIAVCIALLAAYVGIGLATSVLVRHPARATTLVFLIWTSSVALLDFAGIALLLEWRVPAPAVFALAAVNPVQAARLALLCSAEPTLATLGPVGFFLANHVGVDALFALGIAWPALVGVGSWLVAWWAFRRGDAV